MLTSVQPLINQKLNWDPFAELAALKNVKQKSRADSSESTEVCLGACVPVLLAKYRQRGKVSQLKSFEKVQKILS